jgi:phosphohistidine swiveling domain-containing protein
MREEKQSEFPTTIEELATELLIHSKDGRSDPGFRLNIALSQMGNLAAHFTHDRVENPIARPYGSRETEISDAGHAIVQLMTYVVLRNIKPQDAINAALVNLREKDFIARKSVATPEDDYFTGQIVCRGKVIGVACSMDHNLPETSTLKRIAIESHPISDARLRKFDGIITDHGGLGCHAAIIAREYGIPCIVGTGVATKAVAHGDVICLDASGNIGKVMWV